MGLHRFDRVLGAGGMKPTAGRLAERQQRLQWREQNLVSSYENYKNRASHVSDVTPARRQRARSSASTSLYVRPTMAGRATKISSTGCLSFCLCSRNASLINRRARFRMFALPSLRLAMKPTLVSSTVFPLNQLSASNCPPSRFPSDRILANSVPRVRCSRFRNRYVPAAATWLARFALVPSDRCQPFPSLSSPVRNDAASRLGFGTGVESVLSFSPSLRWLISSFHADLSVGGMITTPLGTVKACDR